MHDKENVIPYKNEFQRLKLFVLFWGSEIRTIHIALISFDQKEDNHTVRQTLQHSKRRTREHKLHVDLTTMRRRPNFTTSN